MAPKVQIFEYLLNSMQLLWDILKPSGDKSYLIKYNVRPDIGVLGKIDDLYCNIRATINL